MGIWNLIRSYKIWIDIRLGTSRLLKKLDSLKKSYKSVVRNQGSWLHYYIIYYSCKITWCGTERLKIYCDDLVREGISSSLVWSLLVWFFKTESTESNVVNTSSCSELDNATEKLLSIVSNLSTICIRNHVNCVYIRVKTYWPGTNKIVTKQVK